MTTKTINFTPQKAEALQKRYNEAVEKGEQQFTFEGNEYVTDYAKYLLQHLTNRGLL